METGDLILWDARLIDGCGGPPVEHVTVRVHGRRNRAWPRLVRST